MIRVSTRCSEAISFQSSQFLQPINWYNSLVFMLLLISTFWVIFICFFSILENKVSRSRGGDQLRRTVPSVTQSFIFISAIFISKLTVLYLLGLGVLMHSFIIYFQNGKLLLYLTFILTYSFWPHVPDSFFIHGNSQSGTFMSILASRYRSLSICFYIYESQLYREPKSFSRGCGSPINQGMFLNRL